MNKEESLKALKEFTGKECENFYLFCVSLITDIFAVNDIFSANPINSFGVSKIESKVVVIFMMPIFTSLFLREGILLTKAVSLKTQLVLGKETYIEGTKDEFLKQMNLRNMRNVKVYGDRLTLIQYATEELRSTKEKIIDQHYESLIRRDLGVKQLTYITKE